MVRNELESRAEGYAKRHGQLLGERLGSGVHGIVFVSDSLTDSSQPSAQSAIKVHRQYPDYCRERDVYLRLQSHGVIEILGCRVPELVRYDDALLIIEMTIVTRPFVLDFAGAFLDRPPEFSDEVMADWRAEKYEQYGGRWPEVERILGFLQSYGIYMIDVSPSNISLPGM